MISNQSKTIVGPLTHGYLKLLPDYMSLEGRQPAGPAISASRKSYALCVHVCLCGCVCVHSCAHACVRASDLGSH